MVQLFNLKLFSQGILWYEMQVISVSTNARINFKCSEFLMG